MYSLTATCAVGLEDLIKDELKSFGGQDISCGKGVVFYRGSQETAYRSCLWSRFSSRILLLLYEFTVKDGEDLYRQCMNFPWSEHMGLGTTFAVDGTISGESLITHSRYAALKVKDAVVDYFRTAEGDRPSVDTLYPEIRVHLHMEKEQATLFLDLSGESLHRRGYRVSGARAPLKETLGAAIVAFSGWFSTGTCRPLVDPMCGTGTLLIEAAMMYADSAPGLFRNYFGFTGWLQHDEKLWRELVEEAVDRRRAGLKKDWPVITGYDCDPVVVGSARNNIERAGLEEHIRVRQAELITLQPPAGEGLVVSNLPYGERLSEKEQVSYLYKAFGRIFRERFSRWNLAVFISNADLTDSFGLTWKQKHRLFNGTIPCRLLVGAGGGRDLLPFRWNKLPQSGNDEAGEFGNRLKKNLKKYLRWAERADVSCFRVYDSDLPEYNISVDLYGKWVHIQEYAPPKSIVPEVAEKRFKDAVRQVRDVLGVRSDRVFLKTRQRQKGKKQYQKKDNRGKLYEVREGLCHFLVNFTDYLDTGLFLDHRPLREIISRQVKGKRFLNLFAYTGSATVHAAVAGAASTTTVDLSATYTRWTKLNMAFNGLCLERHAVFQEDCIAWLRDCTTTFDVILVDPPTFSNTKKEKRVFDIQRDHFDLVMLAMSRLDDSGVLFFSTNSRRFILDSRLSDLFDIENMSKKTIPYDFARNRRIHKCWGVKKKIAGSWKEGRK